jgi:limonene-1,2-epoxide hydrolase
MTENEKIIHNFYSAFQRKDADLMAGLYHKDAEFSDPAFGDLKGSEIGSMWKMLCASDGELTISFSILSSERDMVKARWEAWYTFSKTGRKVHNKINASFKIKEALITEHHDVFDLHKWAKQALGLKGLLLGGTSFFRKKLQSTTQTTLQKFISKSQS